MIVKFLLPIVALGMLAFAIVFVLNTGQPQAEVPLQVEPAQAPFAKTVAAAGMIEPESEDISVGSPTPGVAVKVFVKAGDVVSTTQPLFKLDDRALQAELKVRQAALAAAQAELTRVETQPRKEQIPVVKAQITEAEANLADRDDQYRRFLEAFEKRSVSEQELNIRRQAYRAALAKLTQAQAELKILETGAWHQYDVAVAQAAVTQAEAQLEAIKTDIERLTVYPQEQGRVLQVNVRPGQYVSSPSTEPLIVLGSVKELHVRVDIDEHDIPRFVEQAAAKAAIKGAPKEYFPLRFVRIEPYVVPKRSLTGLDTERVDTRVLQVIYAIEAPGKQLYVGQQLDVFIDAEPAPTVAASG